MIIKINNKDVEVSENETIIESARRAGFEIPSLCYAKNAKHKSSCMLCSVQNSVSGQIIPSCTTIVSEGLQIETDNEEIKTIRNLSLELLLSDHRADCEAPCKIACPAGFDVAVMNRLYDCGKIAEAIEFLRNSLVIPATLCYICNAPCEKICRKRDVTEPVAIREIKKLLVAQTRPDEIGKSAGNGKKTAVTGSNPAGLSAAYRLRMLGYEVVILEKAETVLFPYIEAERVPAEIVDFEIEIIKRTGVEFRTSFEGFDGIVAEKFDGIVCVSDEIPSEIAGLQIVTLASKTKQPARLVLEGFKLAEKLHASIVQGKTVELPENKQFNSNYSRFDEKEKRALLSQSQIDNRPSACLYCDCNRKTNCRLRDYATIYGIKNSRYSRETSSQALNRQQINEKIRFEPAKCIRCGLCVYNSSNGFTFKDRGFEMQVVLPEGNSGNIEESLTELCPTGALYLTDYQNVTLSPTDNFRILNDQVLN